MYMGYSELSPFSAPFKWMDLTTNMGAYISEKPILFFNKGCWGYSFGFCSGFGLKILASFICL